MLTRKTGLLLLIGLGLACCSPAAAGQRRWKSLFDGKKLGRWQVVGKFDFINHGKVEVKDGTLLLGMGRPGTGVRYRGKLPKIDYEIALEAMRVEGNDFFCCVTFPVADSALSLVVGGWRGPVVGLSLIDGEPAVENETCLYKKFKMKRWYKIRVRVSRAKVEAWIDKEKVVDFKTNRPPPADVESVPPIYLRQMAAYRSTLALIYPDRPVRCLLLWTDGPTLMELPDRLLDAHAP